MGVIIVFIERLELARGGFRATALCRGHWPRPSPPLPTSPASDPPLYTGSSLQPPTSRLFLDSSGPPHSLHHLGAQMASPRLPLSSTSPLAKLCSPSSSAPSLHMYHNFVCTECSWLCWGTYSHIRTPPFSYPNDSSRLKAHTNTAKTLPVLGRLRNAAKRNSKASELPITVSHKESFLSNWQ